LPIHNRNGVAVSVLVAVTQPGLLGWVGRVRSASRERRRQGTWGTGPFDDDGASDWVWEHRNRETRPSAMRPLALQAVRRVLGPNSELVELWEETSEYEWRANLEKVAAALG